MADQKAATADVDPKLVQEALRRVSAARTEKAQFLTDFTEAFQFCMPWRIRPGTQSSSSRSNTNSQNFTSLGPTMTVDFASDIADTFAPEHTPWAGEEPTSAIPEEFQEDAKDLLAADTKAVFEAISASNFYEAFKQGAKDLSVSAFGLLIEDPGAGLPFRCQVVPLTELLMLRAPTGGIGTRLWEQNVTVQELPELFPDKKLPAKIMTKYGTRKSAKVKKTQGVWRDYSKPGTIAWHAITLLDDEPVEYSHHEGAGSAFMLVCRWDPDAPFAWGTGPAIVSLPEYRTLDEVEYLALKGHARTIDPPCAYDDDGVINLEGGLTNGVMIPRMPGSKIEPIESSNPNSIPDAEAKIQRLEHTIRRHYYLDEPQQEGLTPPTLGQWMDQSMRRQRRLGTPAASIWTEFLSEVFLRFRYLLVQRGVVQPGLAIGSKAISLRPVNPLQRAAEMEEAAAGLRFLESVSAIYGPALAPLATDVGATVHKLADQARATGVVLKTADEINKALEQDAQLARIQQAATAVGQSGVMPLLAQQPKNSTPQ